MEPNSVPLVLASARSLMPFLPQASKSVSGTSVRAGTEPLTTLKADWKVGLSIADAMASCAGILSSATLNIANWSELKVTDPCVPG
ncbi:hypothetical protein D3C72_2332600 [compost metagenome]